jgi:cytosolic iron-sulfur protein assembly protein CIAO1
MTDAAAPAELNLLQNLHPPSAGSSRAWQSLAHPDPSIPLLATASADKSVNIYSLKDFSLVSTISGGHKRSVRTVAWKDFGRSKPSAAGRGKRKQPVVLGTGSFDANVGIWVWNDRQRRSLLPGEGEDVAPEDADATETDINEQEDEESEEWHFSTLLTGPDSEIKSIDFSPAHYPANLLATSSRDKSVWIWEEVEPEEWETIAVLSDHTGDVKCVGWCTGAEKRRRKRRKLAGDGDVDMGGVGSGAAVNGERSATQQLGEEEGEIIGARPLLVSGSYDDTIRLWRDVEEEGDWICVGVIAEHSGTVWDVKWEGHINYVALDLPSDTAAEEAAFTEFEADWQPRIVSCSDDLSVRIWRRELSAAEKEKRREARQSSHSATFTGAPTGFASSRIPSVIRPMSALEKWVQDAVLPQVHVRSVYAVDWSRGTGLIVSCGGDGTIAVYQEVAAPAADNETTSADVAMNGTGTDHTAAAEQEAEVYKLRPTTWRVVAQMNAAHDEFEVNHVCWAERRDGGKRFEDEEIIVSTGDEGDVRIWTLPEDVVKAIQEG